MTLSLYTSDFCFYKSDNNLIQNENDDGEEYDAYCEVDEDEDYKKGTLTISAKCVSANEPGAEDKISMSFGLDDVKYLIAVLSAFVDKQSKHIT